MIRRTSLSLSLSLVWLLFAPLTGAELRNAKPFPPTWQAALDRYANPQNPDAGIVPGAVVIIKSPIWGTRIGTTGYANIQTHEKYTADSPVRIGSITKTFTALTVLSLEQRKLIKLTDPVLKYLGHRRVVPQIPNIDKVTVGDLLAMTTGIRNYLEADELGFSPLIDAHRHYEPEDLLSVLVPGGTTTLLPVFTPGQTYLNPYIPIDATAPRNFWPWWNYSNSNYTLLGMIIEEVTGKPVAEAMHEAIMQPLELDETYYAVGSELPADVVHGYTKEVSTVPSPNWQDITVVDASYAGAAGAVVSTPAEVLRFGEGIFKTDNVINSGTKEKWLTFASADIHFPMVDYGLGVMQAHRTYGDARGHGGKFIGYSALLYYFFDADTFFVCSTNTMDGSPEVGMLDDIMMLVKSAPTNPYSETPRRGSVTLSWQPGRLYGTYQIYVGIDPDAVERATADSHPGVQLYTSDDPSVTIKDLRSGIYYWRVDTVVAQPLTVTPAPINGPAKLPALVNGPVWQLRAR
ncbi:MAG TPA: serine hydrolase domain-containing protein [Thermoanaerobaculia bacterium]|jgi:CubicO group peptidase (beta-lactamase class C family)